MFISPNLYTINKDRIAAPPGFFTDKLGPLCELIAFGPRNVVPCAIELDTLS